MRKILRLPSSAVAIGCGLLVALASSGCSDSQKLPSDSLAAQRAVLGYTPPASAAPMIAQAKADAAARAANAGPEIAKEMASASKGNGAIPPSTKSTN